MIRPAQKLLDGFAVTHAMLHKMWSMCGNASDGYDKAYWTRLERSLIDRYQLEATASGYTGSLLPPRSR